MTSICSLKYDKYHVIPSIIIYLHLFKIALLHLTFAISNIDISQWRIQGGGNVNSRDFLKYISNGYPCSNVTYLNLINIIILIYLNIPHLTNS